jgi:hypothetical protein
MGKAPFVAMQTDLRKEDRIELIAEITGYNRDEVLGKLFRLWAWCTDRGLEDAPNDCDGYAVPERVVRQFLGERGVDAMLGDDCDELAMGVRRPDGLIYLRGTNETVSRLRTLRSTAVAGGRSAAGSGTRGENGRFVRKQQFVQLTGQPETSQQPAECGPETGREPAASSEIPQTTDQKERALAPARAITSSKEPEYDADSPADRGALAERTYQRVSDARLAIAAELGLADELPFPAITPATRPQSFRDLLDRVREEGAQAPRACDRVVTSLMAQAREARDIEWLSLKAFSAGAWRHAREGQPARGKRHERAGPRSRDPTTGRVEPHRPEEYATGDQKL